jgi:hypothetical protein
MSSNDKSVQITFSNSNSNSTRSVKYLIRPNYYMSIQIKKWYYINVYTTIKGYLAVAW